MLGTEFWWLSSDELGYYRYVDLFHQEPYSDEPNTDRDPCSCPMLQSEKRYSLENVNQWKVKFGNINVFRSYGLYSSEIEGEKLIGPFLLDIDRFTMQDGGYLPQYDKALKDTRLLVKEYCSDFKRKDYRIYFTGHKGFHIEIHPRAIGMLHKTDRSQYFEGRIEEINKEFGDEFVDRLHERVRLHDSINSWIDFSGNTASLLSYEIGVDELFSLSVEDILTKGKDLAQETLDS